MSPAFPSVVIVKIGDDDTRDIGFDPLTMAPKRADHFSAYPDIRPSLCITIECGVVVHIGDVLEQAVTSWFAARST